MPSEDIRNIKIILNITINHSQTDMGFVFHSRLCVILFLLVRMGVERGWQRPLDFENWYFTINFLVEKCFSLSFGMGKMNFYHFFPPGRILLSTPGKIHHWPPDGKILPTPHYQCVYCSQWLQCLTFDGMCTEQLYSLLPLPNCPTVMAKVAFIKILHNHHN